MCPGESVEKHILSCHDLGRHSDLVHVYAPKDIISALDSEGFDATVENPETSEDGQKIVENMGDLICFGSQEVRIWFGFCKELREPRIPYQIRSLLLPGTLLHISSISTLTRQSLCALLDPEDALGRDWCLLAVRMGLIEKVPKLEGARRGQSQMGKLLDEWERQPASSIGEWSVRCRLSSLVQ